MNKIIHGDALDKLKNLDDGSIDTIITDPPYGYSFMGKDWDKAVPSVETWQECLRVLKPGAFCCVMSAPRSDVQMHMIQNLTEAGFDTGFTPLYHTYASGFPKALNVHKKLTTSQEKSKHEVRELWRAIIHSTTLDEQSAEWSQVQSLLADMEQGEQRQVTIESIARKEIQVSERLRQSIMERRSDLSEAKRQLHKCKVCTLPTALYINGKKRWLCYGTQVINGSVSWSAIDENGMCTSSQSQSSRQPFKQSDVICDQCRTQKIRTLKGGYGGFQPKPSVEVIIIAMKPLSEKTFVGQALKNKKGISWLDDARIPTDSNIDDKRLDGKGSWDTQKAGIATPKGGQRIESNPNGRFPANLIVSDDVLNDGVSRKAGGSIKQKEVEREQQWKESGFNQMLPHQSFGDSGSYSRYFDLDKWAKTLPFLIVPKASKSEKNEGLDGFVKKKTFSKNTSKIIRTLGANGKVYEKEYNTNNLSENHHPTVKPLKLMSYLITLFSRPDDIVLDPFVGSGTTCLAAKKLGRKYIGIDREEEYIKIAQARLDADKQERLL